MSLAVVLESARKTRAGLNWLKGEVVRHKGASGAHRVWGVVSFLG